MATDSVAILKLENFRLLSSSILRSLLINNRKTQSQYLLTWLRTQRHFFHSLLMLLMKKRFKSLCFLSIITQAVASLSLKRQSG